MKLINSNITPNFSYREIACNDTDCTIILNDTVINHANNMQTFRNWYNRPISPSSWYRTEQHNTSVNGSPTSQHLQGNATDFPFPTEFYTYTDERKREFVDNVAEKWHDINNGVGGFGLYNTFIHLDSRTTRVDFDYRTTKTY